MVTGWLAAVGVVDVEVVVAGGVVVDVVVGEVEDGGGVDGGETVIEIPATMVGFNGVLSLLTTWM